MSDTQSKTKTKPKLTPAEFLIWDYTLTKCGPDGTFQQTAAALCEAINAKNIKMIPRTVQLLLRRLVDNRHLIEVEPSKPDPLKRGWMVPAKYKVVKEFKGDVAVLGGTMKVRVKV